MKLRIVILTTLLMTGPAWSAAPPVIPVQGLLTSASGQPLDGEQSVTFAIYDDHAAANLLWSETQDVTVDRGLFSVYLGTVESLDLALFKSLDNLWLGIKVGDDPEMTRVHLGTTPFAAFAQHSSYTAGQVLKWGGSSWSCSDEYRPTLDCTLEQCQASGMGCQIDCPTGYTTIGCGAISTDPLRMRQVYCSGNGCYCEIQGGSVTCQARCCRIQ